MEFVLRGRLGTFEPNADVFVDDDGRQLVAVIDVAGADPESLRIAGAVMMVEGRLPTPTQEADPSASDSTSNTCTSAAGGARSCVCDTDLSCKRKSRPAISAGASHSR